MIFAFDPGTHTGWAVYDHQKGKIVACGLGEFRGYSAQLFGPFDRAAHDDWLVIERPQVYSARHWKGDQADVIDTALRAGVLAERMRMRAGVNRFLVERFPSPQEWKGQVPKHVHNQRVISKLSAEERQLIRVGSNTHNVIDAIGLALWALEVI